MNKIILEANTRFEDTELREWVSKIARKLDNLNERTKDHTRLIKRLEKEIKRS